MSLPIGASVAGFTVLRLLGEGGMGAVYLVQHPQLPRREVLKVMHGPLATQPSLRARFIHEARLAASLDHPNIVQVYDQGVEGDLLWIRMQYVEGTDLAEAIRNGPLEMGRALHVLRSVGAALDHAHRAGLLHRDVKPANVLLARGGHPGEPERVLLTDFGIAKALDADAGLTTTGQTLFSPAYAAPEIFGADPLDARTDVYALGCVLYELLTGYRPFPYDTTLALISAHIREPPPNPLDRQPHLPPAITAVVATAMAKDRAERHVTCAALVEAAERALGGSPSRRDDTDSTRHTGPDPSHPAGPHRLTVQARRSGGRSRRWTVIGSTDTGRLSVDARRDLELLVRRACAARDRLSTPDATDEGAVLVRVLIEHPTGAERIDYVAGRDAHPPEWDRLTNIVVGPPGRARLERLAADQRTSPSPSGRRWARAGRPVVVALAVVLLSAATLTWVLWPDGAGGDTEQPESPAATSIVGLAFDYVDDATNIDAALGLEQASDDLGWAVRQREAENVGDLDDALSELAEGGCEVVIALGYAYIDFLPEIAEQYPEVTFAWLGGSVEYLPNFAGDNIVGIGFSEEEAAYLAGVAAALTSQTGRVGFLGYGDTPTTDPFHAGFVTGVNSVNPELEVDVQFLTDVADATTNPDAARLVAESMYASDVDVIFPFAYDSGLGVFTAAASTGNAAIGVLTDQYAAIDPALRPAVLTSAIVRPAAAVGAFFTDYVGGLVKAGSDVRYGIARDAVALATTGGRIDGIKDTVDYYAELVEDGSVEVPLQP